ncbi:putative gamma-glutamyltransferase YwrD [Streptomyces afghaniensis 772] [Streptomyces afghaniensis]
MIVSPHYLASQAGEQILQKGGNAFDAAVAVSACLAVVYPHMTGLGGDSFWLTYKEKTGKVRTYNGSGKSGAAVTREMFKGKESIPFRGIESVLTVPGMVDSWDAILKEYGSMTLAEVLQPAIEYAEKGFPLSNDQYENTIKNEELLRSIEETAAVFLPDGKVPEKFSRFVQKNLANTLKQLGAKGRDDFYKGELAYRIISGLKKKEAI